MTAGATAVPQRTPAIEVDGLVKHYDGRVVLDGVTFEVRPGELFAVIGPNGAGKTTTTEIVEGYRAADAGTVRVLGTDPRRGGRAHRARVGIQLQDGGIDPRLTAGEAVALYAALHADPLPVAAMLDRVGLAHVTGTRYRRLSGGERQRLGLAVAIVGRPEVLVLDEPTSGLDVEGRAMVRDLLLEQRAAGIAVLVTSHDLADVERIADRLVILDRGRVVAAGSPEALASEGTAGLRFRLVRPLDERELGGLTDRLGPILDEGGGRYRTAASPPSPALVAALAAWCDARDVQVIELRAGSASLEERYLEILAEAGDVR